VSVFDRLSRDLRPAPAPPREPRNPDVPRHGASHIIAQEPSLVQGFRQSSNPDCLA